jgi:hypothetical protein
MLRKMRVGYRGVVGYYSVCRDMWGILRLRFLRPKSSILWECSLYNAELEPVRCCCNGKRSLRVLGRLVPFFVVRGCSDESSFLRSALR